METLKRLLRWIWDDYTHTIGYSCILGPIPPQLLAEMQTHKLQEHQDVHHH